MVAVRDIDPAFRTCGLNGELPQLMPGWGFVLVPPSPSGLAVEDSGPNRLGNLRGVVDGLGIEKNDFVHQTRHVLQHATEMPSRLVAAQHRSDNHGSSVHRMSVLMKFVVP